MYEREETIGESKFLKIGISTIAGSNLFGCKSFVIRETALFDIRDNVGKFRERVSNRFGTEDDDRSSLSPVSLATCKPNCVTWSETETERSWAREGKERKDDSPDSSAFCGRATLHDVSTIRRAVTLS